MIERHPLGVKPLGNALLDSEYSRTEAMGLFGLLPDSVLMGIIEELEAPDLLALGHTCKALYAYCWFDELWKQIVYANPQPDRWRGSWRKTALKLDQEARIDASAKVYSDFLFRPFELTQIDYRQEIRELDQHQITRVKEAELSPEEFATSYFRRPFIAQLAKPIAEWSITDLLAKFGNELFRQEYMDWPLNLYAEYMQQNQDETPLYLFDCRSKAHAALKFDTPLNHIFGKDFFTLLGTDRPDHQWLIVGPKRSGSTFHKDPNGTSAWNSVVSGHKYWIMFPPKTNPPGVLTDADQSEVTAPVSLAEWFRSGFYREALHSPGFCHAITGPGDCMYVPSGWWHAVANLDECIAMTGNFVPSPQLNAVLDFLRHKPDQISGFRNPSGLYEKFTALLGDDVPSEKKPKRRKVETTVETPFTFSFGT